jgi:hypothetical protein
MHTLENLSEHLIKAVAVNHNTSAYMELMARSLFARHPQDSGLHFSLHIFDNASQDDMTDIESYAESKGIPITQSGFTTQTRHNSHGEVLRRFVLENPETSHYLFLDSDVCFLEDLTLNCMLIELEIAPDAFGIGARMSWDGVDEIPEDNWKANPDIYQDRLHPCCALVKNTPVFRKVVEQVGLSCVQYLWADVEEYLDTFKLMTKVMKTHGLKHIISTKMVMHFFNVSYIWEPTQHLLEAKAERRDQLLEQFRQF